MKILLSGFKPFGEHESNPTEELMNAFRDSHVSTMVLPVSFERAFNLLKHKIDMDDPDYVICFGLAEKREHITPERIAINFIDARIPDNDGVQLRDQPVIPDAPDGLFSTLPLKKITEACSLAKVPAKISDTAGTYVCNDLMYKVIRYGHIKGFKAGFIHIPPSDKLSLEIVKNGVAHIIEALTKEVL